MDYSLLVNRCLILKLRFSFNRLQPCVIADCGEHKDGDSWGAAPNDGTGDTHPDYPEDSDINFKDVRMCEVLIFRVSWANQGRSGCSVESMEDHAGFWEMWPLVILT